MAAIRVMVMTAMEIVIVPVLMMAVAAMMTMMTK